MNLQEFYNNLPKRKITPAISKNSERDRQLKENSRPRYLHKTDEVERINKISNAVGEHYENTVQNMRLAMQSDKLPVSKYCEIFAEKFPKAWGMISKKVFKHTENYFDYRSVYLTCAASVGMLVTEEIAQNNQIDGVLNTSEIFKEVVIWHVLEKYQIPFFFISPKLLDAVTQTDLDFSVDWKVVGFPYPGFNFVLPKNSNFEIRGQQITVCCIIKVTIEDYKTAAEQYGVIIENIQDAPIEVLQLRFETHSGEFFLKTLIDSFDPNHIHCAAENLHKKLTDDDRHKLNKLVGIIFNILFVMSARPEYVERGNRVGTHKKSQTQIWTPNVIGARYQTKTTKSQKSENGTFTRLHWRRGHWRLQRYGIGLVESKRIWIEPVLVGGKNENAK
jgi:hypothetical protein